MNLNTLTLNNTTGADITYPVSGIVVPAGGSLAIVGLTLVTAALDDDVRVDIQAGNITVSDSVSTFSGQQAIEFFKFELQLIAIVSGHHFYSNLTSNATTTVKPASGFLHAININNNTTGGTVTVYDNTAASGTKIATISIGTPSGSLLSGTGQEGPTAFNFDCQFATGLTVVTAGSTSNDITVLFR